MENYGIVPCLKPTQRTILDHYYLGVEVFCAAAKMRILHLHLGISLKE
jgi:hypothetical protein